MPKGERLYLRLTEDEKTAFTRAAAQDELKLSEWLRQLGQQRVDELESTPAGKGGFTPGAGLTR